MSQSKTKDSITVFQGIISAAKWDRNDNVVQMQLGTDDGQTYLLDADPDIFDPFDFLDNYVQITGYVRNQGKKQEIDVMSITDFTRSDWDDDFDRSSDFDENADFDDDLDDPYLDREE